MRPDLAPLPPWADDVVVLEQRADVAVVAKPSGVLVHNSAWAGPRETSLVEVVRARLGPVWSPVHRIDRGASGLVVFAVDGAVARWQRALVDAEKRYVVLVRGRLAAPVVVDHPIRDDDGTPRDAVTHVAPIAFASVPRVSLVVASIRTGRKHQIRRHLKHLSHPVIGDANYGKGPINREFAATFGIDRLALHAWQLGAVADDGQTLTSTCPLPRELRDALAAMFDAAERFDPATARAVLSGATALAVDSGRIE